MFASHLLNMAHYSTRCVQSLHYVAAAQSPFNMWTPMNGMKWVAIWGIQSLIVLTLYNACNKPSNPRMATTTKKDKYVCMKVTCNNGHDIWYFLSEVKNANIERNRLKLETKTKHQLSAWNDGHGQHTWNHATCETMRCSSHFTCVINIMQMINR